ncbi:MAG: hypothetical protein GX793_00540 [Bacteroidales bacterium]|nr:hypothetical protein [Bacteroidales bacterium]NLB85529.1 hypothetical protein [Bacteroidales bacterium]
MSVAKNEEAKISVNSCNSWLSSSSFERSEKREAKISVNSCNSWLSSSSFERSEKRRSQN